MRTTPLIAAGTVLVLALGACGDDEAVLPGDAASGDTVVVHGNDRLQFDQDAYHAQAGEVTFEYVNDGSVPHTLLIEEVPAEEFKLSMGRRDSGSIELEPGEYVLWCDVPGHRQAGMVADLTVE